MEREIRTTTKITDIRDLEEFIKVLDGARLPTFRNFGPVVA